jgi:hypothetical protein
MNRPEYLQFGLLDISITQNIRIEASDEFCDISNDASLLCAALQRMLINSDKENM